MGIFIDRHDMKGTNAAEVAAADARDSLIGFRVARTLAE